MTDDAPGNVPHPSAMAQVKSAPVTAILIVVSVLVAVLSQLGTNREVLTWLTVADLRDFDGTIAGGFSSVLQGQVWRLLTPIFIHFGFIHILFNLLWLKDLGRLIERRWSSWTLAGLVGVSAVLSNVGQFIINWDLRSGVEYANALSGGMSGVVYALLGYLWMRTRFDATAGIRLNPRDVWMMLGWLVLCMTGFIGHIGNSAHAIGLLVGVIWGRVAAMKLGRSPE